MNYRALSARGFLLPSRIRASYEGAGTGRRAEGWQASSSGPADTALPYLHRLRTRSRDAVRNDGYATAAIEKLVSNAIGDGIKPKPQHPNAAVRLELQGLWQDWTEEADADGVTDLYGLQALIARTVFESGECFVRFRPRSMEEGLVVPLQLQALEPDHVPHTKNEQLPDGSMIRAGIEFDTQGRRAAYWMYRSHPGDGYTKPGARDLVRVPASQVLHVYEVLRPGQIRGVPTLAPVLVRLKSLDAFDDAVLFRQEVANLFAGFIKRPAVEDEDRDPVTGQVVRRDADGFTPMVALEPGTMQELGPGDEVEFSTPPDAGGSYTDFMRQQLQAAAAGVGVPYELLTGDMRGVNDRLIRVVLNEFRRRIEQRQWTMFVPQLCQPARKRWIDLAVLSGAFVRSDFLLRRAQYYRTRWVPQGFAYIHPVQDVQSKKMEVRAGFTSRSEVVLRGGYDAEMIDEEVAADNARADRLDLIYDSDPRRSGPGALYFDTDDELSDSEKKQEDDT